MFNQGDISRVVGALFGGLLAVGLIMSIMSVSAGAASAQGPDVVVDADFNGGADGFSYGDINDPSGTNYVRGSLGGGESGGGLTVTLGGINDDDISNMTGAWSDTISVPRTELATISFRYRISMTSEYESNEYGEARLRVDGQDRTPSSGSFPRLVGNGNGGGTEVLGWNTYTTQVTLSSGSHSIELVGFNNAKTYNDETTTVEFDNLSITIPPMLVTPTPTATTTPTATATATATPTATATSTPTAVPTLIPPGPAGVQAPLNGPHVIPTRVEAEDFDFGGPDVAYSDSTPTNIGTQYRASEVDVFTNAGGAGYVLGHTRDGEWVEYTVESATAQSLEVSARVSTGATAPGSLQLDIDGVTVATLPIDRTGGWWTFADESFGVQNFPAGPSVVRVTWLANGAALPKINFDRLNFGASGPTGPTCAGMAQEAETAYLPGSIVEVSGGGASGGAYIQAAPSSGGRPGPSADYAEFCVTVPADGDYRIDAQVLAPNSADDSFYVSVDNGPAAIWDVVRSSTWTTDSVSERGGADPIEYSLTAGDHLIRVSQREDGSALDSIAVVPAGPPTPTPTATSTSTPTPTATPEGVFTLYRDTSYGGVSQNFQPGVYVGSAGNLSAIGNDQASSHRIEAGYLALVCTNGAGTGACRGFTNDKSNLGNFSLNDNISYVQVRQIGDPFTLSAGSDVDQIVNALPPGTIFELQAGVHSGHEIVPHANNVFNCQPGAILDGNGVNGVAFSATRGDAHNVEIRGCEIRNYDQGQYVGAINGRATDNFSIEGLNWLVEDNKIHSNEGPGVNLGSGMTVRNNEIYDNSQIGVSGIGSSSQYLENVKVLDNEVYNNNFGPIYATGNQYHEGGIKVTWTRNSEVSRNDVYRNQGFGIHFDLSTHDILVEDNTVRDIRQSRQWATYIYIEEDSYNVTARGNVITTAPDSANISISRGSLKGIVTAGSYNNTVEYNTINGGHSEGGSWQPLGINYYSGDNNNGNVFRGNTVNLQFNGGYVGVNSSGASGTQFIDNNYTGSPGLQANGNSVGWNSWRNNYGYDTGGSYS